MSGPRFFGDFSKETDDFFKKKNYKLGRQVEIKAECGQVNLKVKGSQSGSSGHGSVTATFKPPFAKIEAVEDLKSGLSLEIVKKDVYKKVNLKSKHTAQDVEVTLDYRSPDSFWCGEAVGFYAPSKDGERLCKGKVSVALEDSYYKLAVGAKAEMEDTGDVSKSSFLPQAYSMGYLYRPSDSSEYSLVYTPDKENDGSQYHFSLLKKYSENCTVAARAEGKADLRLTSSPPVISFGGGWKFSGNYLQGFMNSNKEFGLSYKVNFAQRATLTLGFSSFLNKSSQNLDRTLGYKLQFF